MTAVMLNGQRKVKHPYLRFFIDRLLRKLRFPSQRVSGRHVFNNQLASLGFAVAVTHMFAQLYRGRKVIAVRVLERAEHAALLHKFIDLRQNLFADIVRQGNKRQTANNVADFSETGSLINGKRVARVAAHDFQSGKIFFERFNQRFINFDSEI